MKIKKESISAKEMNFTKILPRKKMIRRITVYFKKGTRCNIKEVGMKQSELEVKPCFCSCHKCSHQKTKKKKHAHGYGPSIMLLNLFSPLQYIYIYIFASQKLEKSLLKISKFLPHLISLFFC